ncbi:MAG: PIN domain-containing protein [Armatimonadetes bacterium]|nr:PIN domain-containing protein [Armatimonadota bacterium]
MLFLETTEDVIRKAHTEREKAGLLTNYSLIISCMRELDVSLLATADRDFERVSNVTVCRPEDLP